MLYRHSLGWLTNSPEKMRPWIEPSGLQVALENNLGTRALRYIKYTAFFDQKSGRVRAGLTSNSDDASNLRIGYESWFYFLDCLDLLALKKVLVGQYQAIMKIHLWLPTKRA